MRIDVKVSLREVQKIKYPKNPHPKGWGYTNEARLRGLI
jgi:hypothetical protein